MSSSSLFGMLADLFVKKLMIKIIYMLYLVKHRL
jgi:hypothetical protein